MDRAEQNQRGVHEVTLAVEESGDVTAVVV
jgi:hypothetical protein